MELRTPKFLIVRTRGPGAAYWARFKHPILQREIKTATGIFVADLRRGESFSANLAKLIGDQFWWDSAREREAQIVDPIAAQVFFGPMRGYETAPDAPSTEFKEALKQARGERDAAIEKIAVLQLELQEAKREIQRLNSQLGLSVVEKDWLSALKEYLEWGNAGGGRLGKPWSPVHARSQDTRLGWWGEQLRSPLLTEITLSVVEQAIAKITGAAKTKSDYVMTLRGFLTWARKHSYLSADPLMNLAKLGKESETDWRSLTLNEVRRLLAHAAPERRLFY